MPYYHATWAENIPSILKHGLGGAAPTRRNFAEAHEAVYLCCDPVIAAGFLFEALTLRDDLDDLDPQEVLDSIRVIVIDDSRLDPNRLRYDPELERKDITRVYEGVIDVRGLIILTREHISPTDDQLSTYEVRSFPAL